MGSKTIARLDLSRTLAAMENSRSVNDDGSLLKRGLGTCLYATPFNRPSLIPTPFWTRPSDTFARALHLHSYRFRPLANVRICSGGEKRGEEGQALTKVSGLDSETGVPATLFKQTEQLNANVLSSRWECSERTSNSPPGPVFPKSRHDRTDRRSCTASRSGLRWFHLVYHSVTELRGYWTTGWKQRAPRWNGENFTDRLSGARVFTNALSGLVKKPIFQVCFYIVTRETSFDFCIGFSRPSVFLLQHRWRNSPPRVRENEKSPVATNSRIRTSVKSERFQPSRSSCVRVAAINANVYYERRPAMECRRSGTKHLDREPPTIRLARWIAPNRVVPRRLTFTRKIRG